MSSAGRYGVLCFIPTSTHDQHTVCSRIEYLSSDSGEVDANQHLDRYRIEEGMFCQQSPSTTQHTARIAPPTHLYKKPPPPLIRAATINTPYTIAPYFHFQHNISVIACWDEQYSTKQTYDMGMRMSENEHKERSATKKSCNPGKGSVCIAHNDRPTGSVGAVAGFKK